MKKILYIISLLSVFSIFANDNIVNDSSAVIRLGNFIRIKPGEPQLNMFDLRSQESVSFPVSSFSAQVQDGNYYLIRNIQPDTVINFKDTDTGVKAYRTEEVQPHIMLKK